MKLLAILGTLVAVGSAGLLLQDEISDLADAGRHHRGRPGEDGDRRDPLFVLFDTDDDEILSADEIASAVTQLRARDRDADGRLTRDELPAPRRPGRPGHAHRSDARDHHPARPAPAEGPPRAADDGHRRPAGDESAAGSQSGRVIIRGGLATDARDGGRPVRLIAAALGVADDVFRDAFSNVRPARLGSPSGWRVQTNKRVLMEALGPYGITNERLDMVSDYYRCRPQAGELWPHQPATATAVIEDGQVVRVTLQSGGHGYLTPPEIVIAGYEDVHVDVELEFGSELATNGRIASLQLVLPDDRHPSRD